MRGALTLLLASCAAACLAVPARGDAVVYDLPDGLLPTGVTAGPDGRTWFSASNREAFVPHEGSPGSAPPVRRVVGSIGRGGDIRFVADRLTPWFEIDTGPPLPGGTTLMFGADGNLYSNTGAFRTTIARMSPRGVVNEIATGVNPAKPVGHMARDPDGTIWFASFTGVGGRFLGRLTPAGGVQLFTRGLTNSPSLITSGPGDALTFLDSGTRLWRLEANRRVRRLHLPVRTALRGLTTATDGRIWLVSLGPSRPGLWRLGPRDAFSATCRFRPLPNVFEGAVPAADGGVWTVLGRDHVDANSYPAHVSRTGRVTSYPRALPAGTNRARDIDPGPAGSLLLAYVSGPDDPRRQTGHIARITTGTGGRPLCSSPMRRITSRR